MRYRKASTDQLTFRASGALTIEEGDSRSAPCVLATDLPVGMRDAGGRAVDEILLMSGAEIPDQVPLLDSHERGSVASILGSVRELKAVKPTSSEHGRIDGVVTFSGTPEGESALTKYREKHLRDISVGYLVLASTRLKAGESKVFEGKRISGPAVVVTRWKIKEGSVTALGADAAARLRNDQQERTSMNPELRAKLMKLGLAAEASDADALAFLNDHHGELATAVDEPPPVDPDANGAKADPEKLAARIFQMVKEDATRTAAEATERRRNIDSLCEVAGVDVKAEYYSLTDMDAVRKAVKSAREAQRTEADLGLSIRFGDSQPGERGHDAMRYRMVSAALEMCGSDEKRREATLETINWDGQRTAEGRKKGLVEARKNADDLRHFGPLDIAARCLMADGYDLRGVGKDLIAQSALCPSIARSALRMRAGGTPALMVTASFPNITLDAINKSMMIGYDEFPSTWQVVMRRGQSVPDFKNINRIVLGTVPNPPVWVDNSVPEAVKIGDGKEVYAVESRSLDVSYSWKLLVNDDMSVLSRTPQMIGRAFARGVNATAWTKVTENRTMRDSQAFFLATATGNRFRSNSTTGAGAPSVATVQTLTAKMMLMRSENTPENAESDAILNLMPKYIIGPAALRTTILQLVRSTADPLTSLSSAVYNPTNTLEPVIEPLLDANSTTRWYLAASQADIDGFEVTFLSGQETPQVRPWEDPQTMSQHYFALQTYAAEALEWRGWQRHDGA